MRYSLARALSRYDASLEDRSEAVTILEDVLQTARQVFGAEHPLTRKFQVSLFAAQYKLEHGDPLEGCDDPKEALMQMLAAASVFKGSAVTLGNGRVGEKALVRSWGIIEAAYSDLRRVFGAGHHNTLWALSVRDHIRETHGSMVVLETNEGMELVRRNITWGAIWAAARKFKAMGASDAEIRAALPAFGRLGVDAAEKWK